MSTLVGVWLNMLPVDTGAYTHAAREDTGVRRCQEMTAFLRTRPVNMALQANKTLVKTDTVLFMAR